MKHPMTSQWNVAKTSQSYSSKTSYWNVVTTSQGTQWRRPISTSPRHLKQVSNEKLNGVSVVRHQDVSVVLIHDVPLVHLCDVSCNSQMKHPITSLWYVSRNSRSYVVGTPCLYDGLYYAFKKYKKYRFCTEG